MVGNTDVTAVTDFRFQQVYRCICKREEIEYDISSLLSGNGDKLPSKHWNNKQPNPRHTGKIFSARKGMEEHDVYTWTMEHWRFDE
jgi:hypothetical protein